MLLLPLVLLAVFTYGPMYGQQIAFRDFKINRGIWGSEWIWFDNFIKFTKDIFFTRVIANTLRISIVGRIFTFPAPIIFALLINEIGRMRFKRVVQTISYLPHFLSWVIIASFVMQILSPEAGIINTLMNKVGLGTYYFLGDPKAFVPVLISAQVWAGVGWSSIVYLAAIAAIDQEMYESAAIDGINRFQNVIYITLPSIAPTITILFILSMSGIMTAAFDPVFNLKNNLNLATSQTIELYIYTQGLEQAKYSYSAAISFFQNVIGLIFVLGTDFIAKKINGQGLF